MHFIRNDPLLPMANSLHFGHLLPHIAQKNGRDIPGHFNIHRYNVFRYRNRGKTHMDAV